MIKWRGLKLYYEISFFIVNSAVLNKETDHLFGIENAQLSNYLLLYVA